MSVSKETKFREQRERTIFVHQSEKRFSSGEERKRDVVLSEVCLDTRVGPGEVGSIVGLGVVLLESLDDIGVRKRVIRIVFVLDEPILHGSLQQHSKISIVAE